MPIGGGAEGGISVLLYKFVWIPVLAFFGKIFWDESRLKSTNKNVKALCERLEEVDKEILIIRSRMVEEPQIRALLKEALEPFYEDQKEQKADIKIIAENIVQLRIEMAASNAARG